MYSLINITSKLNRLTSILIKIVNMFQNDYFNENYSINTDSSKTKYKEPSGYLISVKVSSNVEFVSYEIYNFIEQTVKVELEDISLFRTLNGTPTGLLVAQFTEEVTQSRLQKLESKTFKGSPIQVRLFQTIGAFHKFIRSLSESKLDLIRFNNSNSIPIIYLQNFDGDSNSVNEFFSKFSQISMIKPYKYRDSYYYVLFFTDEASAIKAHRTFNGFEYKNKKLIVAPLYKNAAERTFAIHHCQDPSWLKKEIEYFGDIEQIKQNSQSEIFVQMTSLESAKAACVLLNNKVHDSYTITTNFVDYDYFQRI